MHARKRAYTCGGGIEICKKCNLGGFWLLRLAESYPVAASDGDGLRTGSGRARAGTIGTRTLSQGSKFRGRRRILARSGTDFVAGASLSQGQVQIS